MRYLFLAAVLVIGFAAPGVAQQSGTLSYTLSGPPTQRSATTFKATIGGVQGTITTTATTTTGGRWTMTVDGKTFASGAYTCGGGSCSFTGSNLSGKSLSFSMTKTSGTLPGLFANHGAWVSTVAGWANKNLSGENRGAVVSQAAGGAGHDPSDNPSHGSGQSASGGDQGRGHGAGSEHGGGQGHSK